MSTKSNTQIIPSFLLTQRHGDVENKDCIGEQKLTDLLHFTIFDYKEIIKLKFFNIFLL